MAEDKGTSDTAKREEQTLAFWKKEQIFEKSLAKPAPRGEFVFYDGPPFATGLPHHGHILGSTSKDVFGRYKTMRGYHVRRRWGWDCHGLPIESIVEKKLGLKNKKEILTIGVETFNEAARSTVLEFIFEWKRYIERIGRFVDFDNSYKTMDNTFIESVWWGLQQVYKKGNVYEGRRVLMYCPHCETPLAKAEIAMDNTYKDVTEEAVTVEFRVKGLEKTSFLAWTTTPWTLPGNVALAVHPDITYVVVEKQDTKARFILAKERLTSVFENESPYTVIEEKQGSSLVGMEYEPPYHLEKVHLHAGKKWQVLPAHFVTTGEGTGVVHTAVMYGEDDYTLGLAEGLPMIPLLHANGTYNMDAPAFLRGQYIKKAEPLIKEDLEKRSLLFLRAPHTHSYPHCHRCGTALIYNAVSSWFINIQKVKQKLLSENKKIHWIPAHLQQGRFKHILETAPDWTISRNRFWASPLPFWRDPKGKVTVIGSLEELKAHTKKSGNTYIITRHGESSKNIAHINSTILGGIEKDHHLTEKGKQSVMRAAQKLRAHGVDMIVTSPFTRSLETATLLAQTLGLLPEAIVTDARLREIETKPFEGKDCDEYTSQFSSVQERFTKIIEGVETFAAVRQRVGEFLYELEHTYQNKKILIVSHADPLWILKLMAQGAEKSKIEEYSYPDLGEALILSFVPLPHNKEYELDLHLPYLDQVSLLTQTGEPLTRTSEVVDCWLESGSMPFAEYHYPMEHKDEFEKRTPADFISEYIAQTRTWFYYMHVLSVTIFGHRAFNNVVTTGTILAGDGEKMSKSKNNFTDPMKVVDLYGADALRYYLMSNTVMQAEDMNFRDEELKEVHSRVVNILRNTLMFYRMYADQAPEPSSASSNVLDRWIGARFDEVRDSVTSSLEAYDTIRAARQLKDFITDFSTWYVRRSRDRVKTTGEDATQTLATMRYILLGFSQIIAPVMPFVAEEIYQEVKTTTDPQSVHLSAWPTKGVSLIEKILGGKNDVALLFDMQRTRAYASEALMRRQKENIKVRQPLASLSIAGVLGDEFVQLLKDEVNVKKVIQKQTELTLDTQLTPELISEGDEREKARAVAEARKTIGLSPRDIVTVTWGSGPHTVELSKGTQHFTIIRYETTI